ncbi:MAG TPA: platelet-activating factor acetylhydrolase IB subunit [Tepidisphaeraceae bacterium]|nr:platelet-activating factor acetylhydrolase IB subunit [Tepidisphaeraceae bacterium]
MKRCYLLLVMCLALGELAFISGVHGDAAAPAPAAQSAAQEPADVAAPKLGPDGQLDAHFKKDHEEFLQRRTQGKIGVLFLGDSITEGWHWWGKEVWPKYYPQMDAANFGIGGDKTEHVLWRIDNGELDGISPKVLVLLIGTNNIGYTADEILKGDEKIIQEIHDKLPNTKLLILGIFPRGADPTDAKVAEMRDKIKTVNEGLAKLDDGSKTRFLDIGDKFLGADGTIDPSVMKDALHPTPAGYEIWADNMNPLLDQMMQ